MYAQQSRFDHGADFVRFAAEAGYDSIEISHSTRPDKLQQIIDHPLIPITSVHQPAPWTPHRDGRGNSHLNLASIDDAERNAAIEHAKEASAGPPKSESTGSSSISARSATAEMFPEEFQMRRLYDSGEAEDGHFRELRYEAITKRSEMREPCRRRARNPDRACSRS
jgi:hypothetical protein